MLWFRPNYNSLEWYHSILSFHFSTVIKTIKPLFSAKSWNCLFSFYFEKAPGHWIMANDSLGFSLIISHFPSFPFDPPPCLPLLYFFRPPLGGGWVFIFLRLSNYIVWWKSWYLCIRVLSNDKGLTVSQWLWRPELQTLITPSNYPF